MGTCDIKIEINDIRQIGFTSLDTIQGKIFINLSSEITLNSIQIKLIGVAKTSFEGKFNRQSDKIITKEEKHLLLYETKTIFPIKESKSKELSLSPGEHDFQFNIKIPLNNSCYDGLTNNKNFNMFSKSNSNLSLDVPNHRLQTLPPSLSDLKPYASIYYYLKVIIKRPSLLKSNITKEKTIKLSQFNGVDNVHRSAALNFVRKENIFKDKIPEIIAIIERTIPIEPPKTPILKKRNSGLKTFLFGESSQSGSNSSTPSPSPKIQQKSYCEPPTIHSHDIPFYFEARSYGFLQTIGQPVSIKFYLLSKAKPKKFFGINGYSSGLGAIYLKYFHIELVLITDIRAQDLSQRLVEHKVICSVDTTVKLDLAFAKESKSLNEQNGNPLYEVKIPKALYQDSLVPSKLIPSFKTCNIERRYKFIVTAKFAESSNTDPKKFKTISLDCNITLLSGIEPPFASETAPPTALLPRYEEVGRQSY